MEILFFGSSNISVPFLDEIYKSRHNVALVVTTVDKAAGRGRKITPGAVKSRAEELGIDFIQVEKFDSSFLDTLKKIEFDIGLIVSFGKILPEAIFRLKKARWLNVHPSLLPRYRGPTPIISALLNGDRTGGLSIIEVTPGVDSGDIYLQVKFKIEEYDNYDSYEEKIIKFGKPALLAVLDLIKNSNLNPYPQDRDNIIYTHKITKKDLKIDWSEEAVKIVNRIRAFSLKPGAFCFWNDKRIKILKASVSDECYKNLLLSKKVISKNIKNGTVIKADKNSGILINCNKNKIVKIELLQPEGKNPVTALDFINGYRLNPGDNFE